MDKDFEQKVRRKKWYKYAVVALTIIVAAVLLIGMRIEGRGQTPLVKGDGTGQKITVTVEVRCDTLAQDISKLKKAETASFVPSDGILLEETSVEVKSGASVYDMLYRVCREKDLHLEASYTPGTEKAYVEGIGYLYEFDAGNQSGWMFFVNGESPEYGCSDYTLKDGDAVLWAYTCNMGKDLQE